MKAFFTLAIFFVFSSTAQQAYSNGVVHQGYTGDAGKKKEISIGSNRKSGELQLHFETDQPGDVAISILDQSGKTVLQQTSKVAKTANIIPLKNATGLNEGTYTVQLVANSETYTTRFMIWK